MKYFINTIIIVQFLLFVGSFTDLYSQKKKEWKAGEFDEWLYEQTHKTDSLNDINKMDSLIRVRDELLSNDLSQGWVEFAITAGAVSYLENHYYYNNNSLEKFGDSAVVWLMQRELKTFTDYRGKTVDSVLILSGFSYKARLVLYKPDRFARTYIQEYSPFSKNPKISDKVETGFLAPGNENTVIAKLFKEIMNE